ncbi:MAG TPA: hypothetical protein VFE93_02105, partial [Myxococcaceae bacterium]|nr:hypothetical protein [Myxococcaceae bacterium]
MEADRLAQLGLTVQEGAAGPEVVLPLQGSVVNPLTRRPVPAVTLAVAEELLIPVDPPELVGLPPLAVHTTTDAPELEAQLLAGFDGHVARLQAMASRLEALGLAPCVDPGTLEVRAEALLGALRLLLGGDKQGRLRILEVHRAGALLRAEVGAPFALTQFADAGSFQAHLLTLVGDVPAPRNGIGYVELAERFGPTARVPPTS